MTRQSISSSDCERSLCSENCLTATQYAEVWSQKLKQFFQLASSICTLLAVRHWVVSQGACEHHFGTALGGLQNTRSVTKTARSWLSSCYEWAIGAVCGKDQMCHASKHPPDVILRRSFTRLSTALAVIEGLRTRLLCLMPRVSCATCGSSETYGSLSIQIRILM